MESDGTDRKVPPLSPALDVFLRKVTSRASCLAYMEVIDCVGGNWCEPAMGGHAREDRLGKVTAGGFSLLSRCTVAS